MYYKKYEVKKKLALLNRLMCLGESDGIYSKKVELLYGNDGPEPQWSVIMGS